MDQFLVSIGISAAVAVMMEHTCGDNRAFVNCSWSEGGIKGAACRERWSGRRDWVVDGWGKGGRRSGILDVGGGMAGWGVGKGKAAFIEQWSGVESEHFAPVVPCLMTWLDAATASLSIRVI